MIRKLYRTFPLVVIGLLSAKVAYALTVASRHDVFVHQTLKTLLKPVSSVMGVTVHILLSKDILTA